MTEPEIGERQDLAQTLWKQRWVIAASVVVMIGLAAAYTFTAAKVYQASAVMTVNVATSTPGSVDTTTANQGLAQNYATLLVSPGFLNSIRPVVPGHPSLDSLQSHVSATSLPNSALIQLSTTGPSPAAATALGQAVADGFIANLQAKAQARTKQLQAQDQSLITTYSAQIAGLQAQRPLSPAVVQQIASLQSSRQALIAQDQALVASAFAEGTSAELSAAPVASSTPVSPRKSLNLLGGLILGLVLGAALALLRHRLRPALQSSDEASSATGLSVLASIPLRSRLREPDPLVEEAYRVLSTNLVFALPRSPRHAVVTVIGYGSRVGKTSVALGVARAAAASRRVLLVDGDMRAATLTSRLGRDNHAGLVDMLNGVIRLEQAITEVEPNLWLLPARRTEVNAATLLSGPLLVEALAAARDEFDLVVVDSPPIAGLADGLILAAASDAALVVARAGATKPTELAAAVTSVRQSATAVAGLVMFEEVAVDPYYPRSTRATRRARGAEDRAAPASLRGDDAPSEPAARSASD